MSIRVFRLHSYLLKVKSSDTAQPSNRPGHKMTGIRFISTTPHGIVLRSQTAFFLLLGDGK